MLKIKIRGLISKMHKNRHNMGNFWPVAKKGNKYVATSSHNIINSIPLSVAMRDVLKLVKTTRELKKAIAEKQIKVSGKEIRDTNYPVGLFDIITAGDKSFKVIIGENKKFKFEETKEIGTKIIKIKGKKNLGKKGIQFNMMDGKNVLSKEKANVGDSVVYDYNNAKITKIIKMDKGSQAFVIKGKHAGVNGKIVEIIEQGGKDIAIIKNSGESKDSSDPKTSKEVSGDKEKINVWVKNVIAM